MLKKARVIIWILIITIVFIIFGITISYFIAKNDEQNFLEEIGWSSDISLAAINPERVKRLAEWPADAVASEDYKRVREQILLLGDLFRLKGIDAVYLLAEKDGQVFFIAESSRPSDPGYVVPGAVYQEAPPEVAQVFKEGNSTYTEKYTDEYGTYISEFSPVRLFSNNELVAVLGVDVDYNYYWAALTKLKINFWLGCFLFYLLTLLVFISYSKQAAARLQIKDNEEKISRIIDTVLNGIVVVDEKENIIFWNKASENLFGVGISEAIGRKFSELVSFTNIVDVEGAHKIDNFIFSGGNDMGARLFELVMINRSGQRLVIELSLSFTELGKQKLAIGAFKDISERKKKIDELKKKKKELEDLNNLMIGRELKMIELKKEISDLKERKN